MCCDDVLFSSELKRARLHKGKASTIIWMDIKRRQYVLMRQKLFRGSRQRTNSPVNAREEVKGIGASSQKLALKWCNPISFKPKNPHVCPQTKRLAASQRGSPSSGGIRERPQFTARSTRGSVSPQLVKFVVRL